MGEVVNSWWMYLLGIVVVLFVLAGSIFYIVKSYKDAKKINMDPKILKKTIISSAIFTILPSISILVGVVTLAGKLGVPLPWIRLTVIGALHYEGLAASTAGGDFTLQTLTSQQFVTIAFVMTLGILSGPLFCLFGFKLYDGKLDSNNNMVYTEYNAADTIVKGDGTFYVKLPNDKYIDVYSVYFSFNTPVDLNPNGASPSQKSNELDMYPTASNKIYFKMDAEIMGIHYDGKEVSLNISDDKKTFVGKPESGQEAKFNVDVFFTKGIKTREIGIAKNSVLSTISGLGNKHYITKTHSFAGYQVLFFAEDDADFVNVNMMNGDKVIRTISIPKGSKIPNIGNISEDGYSHNGKWYTSKNLTEEWDYSQIIYNDLNLYGGYEELPVDTSWYTDGADNDGIYRICYKSELVGLQLLSSQGKTFKGETIKLICPIEFKDDEKWISIQNFKGTFDGGYNTITNVHIAEPKSTGSSVFTGFFAQATEGAVIKNLKFNGLYANYSGVSRMAGLVGKIDNARIINISLNNVEVTGQQFVGAITAGAYNSGKIQNISLTNGYVLGKGTDVGSVVGYGTQNIEISNIYSGLNVTSEGSDSPDTGGIIGAHDTDSGSQSKLLMYSVLYTGKLSSAGQGWDSIGEIYGRIGRSGLFVRNVYGNDKDSNKSDSWYFNDDYIGFKYYSWGSRSTKGKLKNTSTLTKDLSNNFVENKKNNTYKFVYF